MFDFGDPLHPPQTKYLISKWHPLQELVYVLHSESTTLPSLNQKAYLHEHVRPCFLTPTSKLRHRLQYAGLWKCFNRQTWLPSSLTFCKKKSGWLGGVLIVTIYLQESQISHWFPVTRHDSHYKILNNIQNIFSKYLDKHLPEVKCKHKYDMVNISNGSYVCQFSWNGKLFHTKLL